MYTARMSRQLHVHDKDGQTCTEKQDPCTCYDNALPFQVATVMVV